MKQNCTVIRDAAPRAGGTAVVYARVSSKEQEREGFSIPAQQKLCREHARTRGLQIIGEFTDIETAKRSGRTKFSDLIAFLRNTTPRPVVLVEKTDRLYRNLKDYALLDDLGVEIHLVKEGTVISEESRSSEKFVHGIKVLVAKQYVDNLGEEASKGLREKAEQGHWPSVAPIGYRNNRETKRIEIDPERGPLVRQLFEKYATGGVTLKELTGYARGIGLTHPRSGRPLVKSVIHRLLHNPVSIGEFDWKGRRYQGAHDPLVSRQLWERTQEVFADANRPRYTQHRFAFTGLLTCGACGCAITAERRKGRYVYYHCTGGRGACRSGYLREEALTALLADIVGRIQLTPEQADWIATALKESQADKEREHRRAVLLQQQRYQTVQQTLDRAYEDRLARKSLRTCGCAAHANGSWNSVSFAQTSSGGRPPAPAICSLVRRFWNSPRGRNHCSCGRIRPNSADC